MTSDTVANGLANPAVQTRRRCILARAHRKNCRYVAERDRLARSQPVHPLRMPRRQSANIPKQRERLGDTAEHFKADDARRFRIPRKRSASEQRLYLRCKAK